MIIAGAIALIVVAVFLLILTCTAGSHDLSAVRGFALLSLLLNLAIGVLVLAVR